MCADAEGHCPLCERWMHLHHLGHPGGLTSPRLASCDRIDRFGLHTGDNVRLICYECHMKHTDGQLEQKKPKNA